MRYEPLAPSKNWELIAKKSEAYIYEHVHLGEEAGYMIAQVGKAYFKISIEGYDKNEYYSGNYTEINALKNHYDTHFNL